MGASADDIISISASGGVGVFLDMPKLSASITHLSDMTANCTLPEQGSKEPTFGSLINVIPSYEVGGGMLWDIAVNVTSELQFAHGGPIDFLSTTQMLPTQCLAFNKQGSLVSPTVLVTSSATPTPTTHGKSAAAHVFDARAMWCWGFLALVMAMFVVT